MRIVKTIFGTLLICAMLAMAAYLLGFLSNLFRAIDIGIQTQSFTSPPTDVESTVLGLMDWNHLRWALVTVGVLVLIILIIIIKGKIENRNRDARNFTVSKKGTYGTANGLSQKKAKKLKTADGEHSLLSVCKEIGEEDTGVILGTFRNGNAVLKNAIHKENMNIFVCGAPGSGKSYMFVRPYLAQCIRRGESFVCTDPSGELLESMGGYAKASGYKVKVFNLVDPSRSDSWNITEEIGTNQLLAQIAVTTIIRNTLEGDRGDPFWDNGEKNLLKSLLLYINSSGFTGRKSIGEMYMLLSSNRFKEDTLDVLAGLDESHPAKMPYNIYAQATEQVQASFASGLATRLQIFQSEDIRNMTGYKDIDLTAPGKEKCAYFIVMSDQDSTYQLLSSLFFSFFFIKLADYGKTCENQALPVKVNVVLDELPSIGIIPDLGRKLATVRKYGINVVPIVQLISQLDNRYSPAERDEIIGCCDTQVWLGSNDMTSAEVLSERSGTMTVDVASKSEKISADISGTQLTSSVGRRPYLTSDEVLRIPLDEAVVVLRGQNVMSLKKFKFKNHPDYKKVEAAEKISLSTYQPSYRQKVNIDTPSTNGQAREPQNPMPKYVPPAPDNQAPKSNPEQPKPTHINPNEPSKPQHPKAKGTDSRKQSKAPKPKAYRKPEEKSNPKQTSMQKDKQLPHNPDTPTHKVDLSKEPESSPVSEEPNTIAMKPTAPVPEKAPASPSPPPSENPTDEQKKGGRRKSSGFNIKIH